MPLDLHRPLAWKTAGGDAALMLDELQANILKGHVRDHMALLLLRFAEAAAGRACLSAIAACVKSAGAHLAEVEAHRADETVLGEPYVGVALSAAGYEKLGVPADERPDDPAFVRGTRNPATLAALGDPAVEDWEQEYREPIDAIVLIGDASEPAVDAAREKIARAIPAKALVGDEQGIGYEKDGRGIEHFGYVDGRSQPLFLVEEIEAERDGTDGTSVWDPSAPLGRVLVRDRGAPDPERCFGSYLVFRKLEQHLEKFEKQEHELADDLGLEDEDAERAGALIVGRFEDGTPVTLQSAGGGHSPVMNDFTYASDVRGYKCPHLAHIRKVNPRDEEVRPHLMARRGQTYGRRPDLEYEGPANKKPAPPEEGVGLLFMAFNSDIAEQFEYTQRTLANPSGGTGADQVIAQGEREDLLLPPAWGKPALKRVAPFEAAVTMRGGEYFFAPSLAFLRAL
jgi:Dyp-type peroxidase family